MQRCASIPSEMQAFELVTCWKVTLHHPWISKNRFISVSNKLQPKADCGPSASCRHVASSLCDRIYPVFVEDIEIRIHECCGKFLFLEVFLKITGVNVNVKFQLYYLCTDFSRNIILKCSFILRL